MIRDIKIKYNGEGKIGRGKGSETLKGKKDSKTKHLFITL